MEYCVLFLVQTLLATFSALETNGVYSALALLALYFWDSIANTIARADTASTNRAASIIQLLFIVFLWTWPCITANIISSESSLELLLDELESSSNSISSESSLELLLDELESSSNSISS